MTKTMVDIEFKAKKELLRFKTEMVKSTNELRALQCECEDERLIRKIDEVLEIMYSDVSINVNNMQKKMNRV